jgi:hypothetical protein
MVYKKSKRSNKKSGNTKRRNTKRRNTKRINMRSRNYKKRKTRSKSNRKNIQKGGMQEFTQAVASIFAPKDRAWVGGRGMGILVREGEGDRGIKPYVFHTEAVTWTLDGRLTIPSGSFINLESPPGTGVLAAAGKGNHIFRSANAGQDSQLSRALSDIRSSQIIGTPEVFGVAKDQAMRGCTNADTLSLRKMWEGELYKLHGQTYKLATGPENYKLYQIVQ